MTFVSDTSPITNLAAIAHLDLLHQLYGVILIPEAVYAELTRFDVPGCVEVQTLDWIQTVVVQDRTLVKRLEAEVYTLIPKRCFNSNEEITAFRDLLGQAIGR